MSRRNPQLRVASSLGLTGGEEQLLGLQHLLLLAVLFSSVLFPKKSCHIKDIQKGTKVDKDEDFNQI